MGLRGACTSIVPGVLPSRLPSLSSLVRPPHEAPVFLFSLPAADRGPPFPRSMTDLESRISGIIRQHHSMTTRVFVYGTLKRGYVNYERCGVVVCSVIAREFARYQTHSPRLPRHLPAR